MSDVAPPLPIPNREVKRISAYDTKDDRFFGKMGHRQEISLFKLNQHKLRRVFITENGSPS